MLILPVDEAMVDATRFSQQMLLHQPSTSCSIYITVFTRTFRLVGRTRGGARTVDVVDLVSWVTWPQLGNLVHLENVELIKARRTALARVWCLYWICVRDEFLPENPNFHTVVTSCIVAVTGGQEKEPQFENPYHVHTHVMSRLLECVTSPQVTDCCSPVYNWMCNVL